MGEVDQYSPAIIFFKIDMSIPPLSSAPNPSGPPCFTQAACRYNDFHIQVLAWEDRLLHLTFSAAAHRQARYFLQRRYPAFSVFPSLRLREEILERFHLFATGATGFAYPTHPLLLESATPFRQQVWRRLAHIPYGETRTYGELAAELGNHGFARAVGGACHANPLALVIPCHRVVAAHGLGGFNGGKAVKEKLLAIEGKERSQGPASTRLGARAGESDNLPGLFSIL